MAIIPTIRIATVTAMPIATIVSDTLAAATLGLGGRECRVGGCVARCHLGRLRRAPRNFDSAHTQTFESEKVVTADVVVLVVESAALR